MAVSFNAKSTAPEEGGLNHTGLTVAAGSNICVLGLLMCGEDPGTTSMTWGGTSMPQIGTAIQNGGKYILAFGLVGAATGNLALVTTRANPGEEIIEGVAFNGVSAINGFASNTGSGTTTTVTITTTSGDCTVNLINRPGTSPNRTSIFTKSGAGAVDSAGQYDLSSGTSTAHTFSVSSGTWAALGFNLAQVGGGGGAASPIIPLVFGKVRPRRAQKRRRIS